MIQASATECVDAKDPQLDCDAAGPETLNLRRDTLHTTEASGKTKEET